MPRLHIPWRQCVRTLCLVAVLLVAACAPAQPTVTPVTIRFAHLDTDKAYYQRLAKEFAKSHPGVTVQLVDTTWTGLANLAPKDADVFVTQQALYRRQQGDTIPLDHFINDDSNFAAEDYFPGTLALFKYQGEMVGIPAWVDPYVMYYNKDLFDRRHVAYPKAAWTWDDFLNTGIALTDPQNGAYAYIFNPESSDWMTFALQHGGRVFDDWQNPTRVFLTDPKTVEAVEWYAALIHKHHVAPTPDEAIEVFRSYSYAKYEGIRSGKVGMWIYPLSYRGGRGWPQPWSFKWGFVAPPRDKQATVDVRVESLVISSAAQQPDLCWQWISFLSHELPPSYAPARQSLVNSAAYEKQVGTEGVAAVRASLESPRLSANYSPNDSFNDKYVRVVNATMTDILNGKVTPAQGLALAQAEMDK